MQHGNLKFYKLFLALVPGTAECRLDAGGSLLYGGAEGRRMENGEEPGRVPAQGGEAGRLLSPVVKKVGNPAKPRVQPVDHNRYRMDTRTRLSTICTGICTGASGEINGLLCENTKLWEIPGRRIFAQ